MRLLLAVLLFPAITLGQTWTQLPDFPDHERDDGAVFVIGNQAYCGTGLLPWWSPTRDMHVLNLNSDTWSEGNDLPEGQERQYVAAFASESDGYFVGGHIGSTNFLNDIWKYNPASGQWMDLGTCPFDERGGALAWVLNGTAYVIGGRNADNNALDEVWAFDLATETWSERNPLPMGGRWRSAGAVHNGIGYLIHGRDENGHFQNALYAYDDENDVWAWQSDFPGDGRSHAAMVAIGQSLYVFGGSDSLNQFHGDLWQYLLPSAMWAQLESIPAQARRGGMHFAHGNDFYYIAGLAAGSEHLKEAWKYSAPVSVEELSKRPSLSLYPNPAISTLTIEGLPPEGAQITLYNISGQPVRDWFETKSSCVLDVQHLAAGTYVVSVEGGQINERLSLIVK